MQLIGQLANILDGYQLIALLSQLIGQLFEVIVPH